MFVTDPEDIKKAMFDEMSEMSDEVIRAYAKDFGVSVTASYKEYQKKEISSIKSSPKK